MEQQLFDFSVNADLTNWQIVNDNVMGGRSDGKLVINEAGNGEFSGRISLENNGGFASVRYATGTHPVSANQKIKIRLRGDGQPYQFRVKHKQTAYWSYVAYFDTSGEWETIIIPLHKMYPRFRGRLLNSKNFEADQIVELGFLIGNKKALPFTLEIDYIAID